MNHILQKNFRFISIKRYYHRDMNLFYKNFRFKTRDTNPNKLLLKCFYTSKRNFSDNEKKFMSKKDDDSEKTLVKTVGNCKLYYREKREKDYIKKEYFMECPEATDASQKDFVNNTPKLSHGQLIGGAAATLVLIILAAMAASFFVSIASTVIVIMAIVAFAVFGARVGKDWWQQKRR